MGVKLYNLSKSIWQAELDIAKACSQGINERLKAAQQSSKNMLVAALAGTGSVSEETLEKIVGMEEDQDA